MQIPHFIKKSLWLCVIPCIVTSCNQADNASSEKGNMGMNATENQAKQRYHRMDVIPVVATYHQNPVAASRMLRERYEGLKNLDKVNQLVQQQNYVEALKHVWSEPNYAKQVEFMVEKANEGHAIFMMEVSLAALRVKPELNTLKSFFAWLKAGIARTVQDLNCVADASARSATNKLDYIYLTAVNKILQKDPRDIEEYFAKNQGAIDEAIYNQVSKVLASSLRNPSQLPAPTWIAYHGDEARNFATPKMLETNQWENLRKEYAMQHIKRIQIRRDQERKMDKAASSPDMPSKEK